MSDRWSADAEEMRTRRILADRVASELTRNEQETGISFFGDADHLKITTYSETMVQSLLRHSYAKIEWLYLVAPGERNKRVHDIAKLQQLEGPERIEGLCAKLPLGTLTIKGKPRNADQHSGIITTPAEIEGLAEVFGE